MTKGKKSKIQKRKFFSDPRNHGKVFKKKLPDQQKVTALRSRGNFIPLPTDDFQEVRCAHGPCLLVGTRSGEQIVNRFFTCAIYRNCPDKCGFKLEIDDEGNVSSALGEDQLPSTAADVKWKYNLVNRKIKNFDKNSEIVWCAQCSDVFENKHVHPGCQFVERGLLRQPTRFLEALDDPHGEAQYFFADEALNVVTATISKLNVDSVLCIGAPRLMESLRAQKSGLNLFLLDFDRRYAAFYKSTEFAQYSMLVHHFFDPSSEQKVRAFLENANRLLIVCDPPFGVFVESLLKSVKKLQSYFTDTCTSPTGHCFLLLALPMFVGKRAVYLDSAIYMHDYRVIYSNHKAFAKQNRSTVRFFTNIPANAFNLADIAGYKFCDFCEYFVHEKNKHCFMCMKCTSKDGSEYRHCAPCMRCYKSSYKHCHKCERCHMPGRCWTENQISRAKDAHFSDDEDLEVEDGIEEDEQ